MQNDEEPIRDTPKLFGLYFAQLVPYLVALIVATNLYSYMDPLMFVGFDLRILLCALILGLGRVYNEAVLILRRTKKSP